MEKNWNTGRLGNIICSTRLKDVRAGNNVKVLLQADQEDNVTVEFIIPNDMQCSGSVLSLSNGAGELVLCPVVPGKYPIIIKNISGMYEFYKVTYNGKSEIFDKGDPLELLTLISKW